MAQNENRYTNVWPRPRRLPKPVRASEEYEFIGQILLTSESAEERRYAAARAWLAETEQPTESAFRLKAWARTDPSALLPAIVYERLYEDISAKIEAAESRIVAATTGEGEKTRDKIIHTTEAVVRVADLIQRNARMTIFDCIRENPWENIKIICMFFLSLMIFSILCSIFLDIHLVNPLFAILCSIASAGFWMMARFGKTR
ncbi:MAG: hypothetical protein ACLQME_21255 [Alphaproteobacteria bacterium]